MTLKGKQNHYNVKLLRGYEVSINQKDNRIILKNRQHGITRKSETDEYFVIRIPYEKIVIPGMDYVSIDSIKLLSEKNVNVILTDTYRNLVSSMNGVMSSAISTRYRIGQYDTFRDPKKSSYLSRQIVKAKLDSQINFSKI